MTARPTVKAARRRHVVKAWAMASTDTGRLVMEAIDQPRHGSVARGPVIFTIKSAATRYRHPGERVVRVTVTEVDR